MDDYRLHLQAGEPGDEGAWFWRLDDAAGLQIAASWAASLADALDAVRSGRTVTASSPRR